MWGIALTHSVLFYMEGFSYISGAFFFNAGSLFSMPCSISYQEFVLHTLCKFMCGDFLIVCPVFFRVKSFFVFPMLFYVGSFSYKFTCHVLVYLGSFSCTLHASLCGQFLLHILCCFTWRVSLTRPVLFYVGSSSYTPLVVLCGDFLLHTLCCFLWVVSLTLLMLCLVSIFYYTLDASFSEEFLLHS